MLGSWMLVMLFKFVVWLLRRGRSDSHLDIDPAASTWHSHKVATTNMETQASAQFLFPPICDPATTSSSSTRNTPHLQQPLTSPQSPDHPSCKPVHPLCSSARCQLAAPESESPSITSVTVSIKIEAIHFFQSPDSRARSSAKPLHRP